MIAKNRIRLFHPVIQSLWVAFLLLAVCGPGSVLADPDNSGTDEIFGGQILSLTAKKPPLKPSNDPRFQDNKDGTVTDLKEGLMWKQIDIYQEKKIWMKNVLSTLRTTVLKNANFLADFSKTRWVMFFRQNAKNRSFAELRRDF